MTRRIAVWMTVPASVLVAASLSACGGGAAPSTELSASPPAARQTAAVTAPASVPAASATASGVNTAAQASAAPAAAPAQTPAPKSDQVTSPVKPPASPAAMPAANPDEFADDPVKPLMVKACTSCHSADQVTTQRKSEAQWKDTVDKMIGYGAPVSDAEFPQIVAYLTKHYGS